MVRMEFKGYNRVRNALRGLASKRKDVSSPIIAEWLKKLRATLKSEKYPPKLPNQKYIRTGNLANRWAVQDNAIINRAKYAGYVVGKGTQAEIHQGRWWTMQDVVNRESPKLVKSLSERYEEIWEV